MTGTFTVFALVLTLGGTEVTQMGPFDAGSCFETRKDITVDLARGYSPHGMAFDNVGGGAIYRLSDYELTCVSKTYEDGKLVKEMTF